MIGYNTSEVMEMLKNINEAFFDNWTEESAYTFGLIWADGTLTKDKNSLRVRISNSDLVILEKIRTAMESDLAITEFEGNYSFGFGRQHLVERLQELGLEERKSKTKIFPTSVPREFLPHFIRGYFDGNGYFTYEIWKGQKRRMKSGFTFGSRKFGEGLLETLRSMGIKGGSFIEHKKKASSYGESLEVRLYTGDTKKLYDIMYENATIYMERKKEYYDTKIGS